MKFKRACRMCGDVYEAGSGSICASCWPAWRDQSPEWREFIRQFPWIRDLISDRSENRS